MTREHVAELMKIDNEIDAMEFAQRILDQYHDKEALIFYCHAKDIFDSDLRWCFSEEEAMPFDRIAMWAKVFINVHALDSASPAPSTTDNHK